MDDSVSEEYNMAPSSDGIVYVNPFEGPSLLALGIIGILSNSLCLLVLQRQQELKLSPDYIFLLKLLSLFDLLYLITSTPLTSFPYMFPSFRYYYEPFVLPWIFPFMQITVIASIYTTIALAVERYLSIRSLHVHTTFPVKTALVLIVIFSFGINIPRFFELRAVRVEKNDMKQINNTGFIFQDYALTTSVHYEVKPIARFYTVAYFLGYNMIGSFLISLFIPVVTLGTFNTLIWKKLQHVRSNRVRLGLREKQNARATRSLVLVVIFFFICHSMKFVVSGYQLVDSLINPVIRTEWPVWVQYCTYFSHLFLAFGASVNIFLYCSCDKRFFVVVQKTLKTWFIWPFTTKSSDNNGEDTARNVSLIENTCQQMNEESHEGIIALLSSSPANETIEHEVEDVQISHCFESEFAKCNENAALKEASGCHRPRRTSSLQEWANKGKLPSTVGKMDSWV